MKITNFLFIILAGVLILGLSGFALAKSDNAQTGNTEQNQNQNQNQGEDIQNQEQENEQEQNNETEDNSVEGVNQLRETKQLRINIEEHTNTVSNFIEELQSVADNQKSGIVEQVRLIAQEQNEVREKIADEIESIQERNKIKTFLFGSNYKNLGELRSEMVQTRNRLEKLTGLMEQTTDEADKTELQNQIQTMEQERLNIENFVKTNESKFSLFGWLVKLFNKDSE